MKKTLLALVLFLALLLGFPIGKAFALETVYLSPEFIDNYTYNLETGAFTPNTSWACTNRETVPVGTAVVTVNNLLAHHVLFFTATNGYIGYGNLITSYEGGSKYISTYSDSSIELPANTGKVAFTVNKLGVGLASGLGAYTYADIFENPSYLTYDDAVLGDTIGDVFTNGSYTDYNDSLLGTATLDEAFNSSFDLSITGSRIIETAWTDSNSDGLADGWNKNGTNMTPSVVGGTQRADWSADNSAGYFYYALSFTEGHVYYAQVTFTDGTTAGTQYMAMRNGTSIIPFQSDMGTGVNYGTATALWSASAYFRLYIDSPKNGDYVVFDNLYVYDLTAIFGAGREVSASTFYRYLQAGTISSLSGASNIGYSKANLDAQASEFGTENITVLSLTNLVQNGQFSNGTTGWTGGTLSVVDGKLNSTAVSQYGATFQSIGAVVAGQNSYFRWTDFFNSSNQVSVRVQNITATPYTVYYSRSANNTNISDSVIFTFSASSNAAITITDNRAGSWTTSTLDNVVFFNNIGSYTKSQIDTALGWSGYLTYNTAYSLPDTTDSDFTAGYYYGGANIGAGLYIYDLGDKYNDGSISAQTSGAFDTWLSKWAIGSYTLSGSQVTAYNPTALYFAGVDVDEWTDQDISYYKDLYSDAFEQVERYEWFTQYGITSGNYGYYTSLYDDAVNEVERWEWYLWAGVNATNYTALRASYDFLDTNYSTTYTFGEFDNLTASYTRDDIVPIEDMTVVEKIEDWFENTLGLAEFADFFYFIISLVLVVIIVIVLALFHAPSIVIFIVGGLTLVLFIAIGWFPFWLAILLTMGLLALFIFKKPSGGNA